MSDNNLKDDKQVVEPESLLTHVSVEPEEEVSPSVHHQGIQDVKTDAKVDETLPKDPQSALPQPSTSTAASETETHVSPVKELVEPPTIETLQTTEEHPTHPHWRLRGRPAGPTSRPKSPRQPTPTPRPAPPPTDPK